MRAQDHQVFTDQYHRDTIEKGNFVLKAVSQGERTCTTTPSLTTRRKRFDNQRPKRLKISWLICISQTVNGFVWGWILALISIGLTLIFGQLSIVNVAHGVLFTLGAVGAYYCFIWLHSWAWALLLSPLFLACPRTRHLLPDDPLRHRQAPDDYRHHNLGHTVHPRADDTAHFRRASPERSRTP